MTRDKKEIKAVKETKASEKFNVETSGLIYKNLLKSCEQKSDNLAIDCFNCAYKNKSINHCWYTVITDKTNRRKDNCCEHFVDLERFLDDKRKHT